MTRKEIIQKLKELREELYKIKLQNSLVEQNEVQKKEEENVKKLVRFKKKPFAG